MIKKISLITIILGIIFLTSCTPCTSNICMEENCYEVEIPRTTKEIQQGLMYREELPKNQGMLFIFPQNNKYDFWMKNTLIPLDIIWINEELEIIRIEQAEPCKQEPCPTYGPEQESRYVLEINKGQTQQKNITTGTKITMNLCD